MLETDVTSCGRKLIAVTPAPEKRLLAVLNGQSNGNPPIWLMRQAGRYLPEYRVLREKAGGFLEFCYNSELAAEATLQPVRRYGMDGAILFADILLIAQALGQSLMFREGEGPVLEPIRDEHAIARLDFSGIHDRLSAVYETVGRVKKNMPIECTLIGFAGGPWTVATYMVEGGTSTDHINVKRWAFTDPDTFEQLINLLVEATASYLVRQIQAGAEALQIFESWAGILPEDAFDRWCIKPVKEIIRRIKADYPDIPIVAFPRGAGLLYRGYAEKTKADALGLDPTVPARWATKHLQPDIAVQGNLDPQLLLIGGEPMRKATAHLLERFGNGRYIFNLGHGVLPQTPVEHVAALVRQVKTWRS